MYFCNSCKLYIRTFLKLYFLQIDFEGHIKSIVNTQQYSMVKFVNLKLSFCSVLFCSISLYYIVFIMFLFVFVIFYVFQDLK